MKLHELISDPVGAKFPITVGEVTKELTLDRLEIIKMVELENEGIKIDDLLSKFEEKPATVSTKIGWLLLTSSDKAEFNNDYTTFVRVLRTPEMLQILGEAVMKAITNSRPVEDPNE